MQQRLRVVVSRSVLALAESRSSAALVLERTQRPPDDDQGGVRLSETARLLPEGAASSAKASACDPVSEPP
jgi:hypothetical protein